MRAGKAVSTHSRPKAAGGRRHVRRPAQRRFNSQPPEGGWLKILGTKLICAPRFNSQPPEGGWQELIWLFCLRLVFQLTAARRRLVQYCCQHHPFDVVSTHSRPKAAGIVGAHEPTRIIVSTHSRPKAAGRLVLPVPMLPVFQLTAARRRLAVLKSNSIMVI